ncbi:unnamed protein product [Camellia sinensis]
MTTLYNKRKRSFVLGKKEMKLRSSDVKLIFGIDCGEDSITTKSYARPKDFQLPFYKRRCKSVKRLDGKSLTKMFQQTKKGKSTNDRQDLARVITLYLCLKLLMPTTGHTLSWSFLNYVDNLNNIKKYNWVEAIKDTLMNSMANANNNPRHVTGCVMLLLYWYCEYSKLLRPSNKEGFPRFMKWNLGKMYSKWKHISLAHFEKVNQSALTPTEQEIHDEQEEKSDDEKNQVTDEEKTDEEETEEEEETETEEETEEEEEEEQQQQQQQQEKEEELDEQQDNDKAEERQQIKGHDQPQTPTKEDDKDKLISAMRAQMQEMEQKFMAELRKKEDQLKEMSTKKTGSPQQRSMVKRIKQKSRKQAHDPDFEYQPMTKPKEDARNKTQTAADVPKPTQGTDEEKEKKNDNNKEGAHEAKQQQKEKMQEHIGQEKAVAAETNPKEHANQKKTKLQVLESDDDFQEESIPNKPLAISCRKTNKVWHSLSKKDQDQIQLINNTQSSACVWSGSEDENCVYFSDICRLTNREPLYGNVIDAFSQKQLALQPTIEEFEKNDLVFASNPYAGRSYVFSTLINNHWTIVVFDNADGIWRHYDSLRPAKDCHNKYFEIAKQIRMAFKSKEMMKKIMKKIGGEKNLGPGVKESLKKCVPDSKVVMGKAHRGIFAGRHIQFGNRVSEDGGNKSGEKNLGPGVKESLKKCVPDSKVVMGRAHRGIFAGRHIQFGNRVGEDGGNKTRRNWKPNVQEKRLFSYILDRHIRVKVTTHALRCIDKAGGIDEYLLKTPYQKMDTEMGLFWKAKIEKMYEELGEMGVVFFSPEDEAKFEEGFKELKLAERAARRDARRQMYGWSGKQKQIEQGVEDTDGEGLHSDVPEQLIANSNPPPQPHHTAAAGRFSSPYNYAASHSVYEGGPGTAASYEPGYGGALTQSPAAALPQQYPFATQDIGATGAWASGSYGLQGPYAGQTNYGGTYDYSAAAGPAYPPYPQ